MAKFILSDTPIESLGGYMSMVIPFGKGWIYRGHAEAGKFLIPKVGRGEFRSGFFTAKKSPPDLKLLNAWRRKAVAFREVPDNLLEAMALAQHYGFPTRLLDWSENPLVALYFACQGGGKGEVFACSRPEVISAQTALGKLTPGFFLYLPPWFDRRIVAQRGVFTYHTDPAARISTMKLISVRDLRKPSALTTLRFTVPASRKERLLDQLEVVGIGREQLFPDLDGLAVTEEREWKKTLKKIAQIAAGDRLLREIDSEFSGQKPNSEGGASPAVSPG